MGEFDYVIKHLENKRYYYNDKLEESLAKEDKNWSAIQLCVDRIKELDLAIDTLIANQFI